MAFVASMLSVPTGFGLGSVLLPVLAFVAPLDVAVAATAIAHLAAGLSKAALLGRFADPRILVRFGLPAVFAAFLGAAVLGAMPDAVLATYDLAGPRQITALRGVLGLLIVGFAVLEMVRRAKSRPFPARLLPLGGAVSGFFGGLSGHQGALRSIVLSRLGLSVTAMAGTAAVLAVLVDLARLAVYAGSYQAHEEALRAADAWPLLGSAVVAAVAGVVVARRFLHAVAPKGLRLLVGGLLCLVGALLAVGLS